MPVNLLLILPLLIPLIGAVISVLFWQKVKWHIIVVGFSQLSWVACAVLLLVKVIQHDILVTQIGNWPAPYGITIVADVFSALILMVASLTAFAVFLFSIAGLSIGHKKFGYYTLMLLLQMGVAGVCLTGDIFNLFVWFELLLICSFALLSLGGSKAQLEGTLKYVTINFIASGLLLTGVGVIYSLFGSLNMAELSHIMSNSHQNVPLLSIAGVFFLTGFGVKAAIFPLFFWLPASYHTPPIAISAFIAGLISKLGIYALIRLLTLIFAVLIVEIQPLLLTIAGFTMVIGVIGAAAQTDFKKILSFHVISQIGYMLMGLAIYTPLALAGCVFFILHNVLVKSNLFLISGVVAFKNDTYSLKKLGGIYTQHPILAIMFFVSAMALAGLPPLSGFWGKLMLVLAGFEAGNYTIVGVSLAVSLITLFSMTKIWNEVFWKPNVTPPSLGHKLNIKEYKQGFKLLHIPVGMLFLIILFISFYADPIIELSKTAAHQLLHSEIYINAVLKH